jgi:hypothetical protein
MGLEEDYHSSARSLPQRRSLKTLHIRAGQSLQRELKCCSFLRVLSRIQVLKVLGYFASAPSFRTPLFFHSILELQHKRLLKAWIQYAL